MANFLKMATRLPNSFLKRGVQTTPATKTATPAAKKKPAPTQASNQLSAKDMVSLFKAMPVPNRGFKSPNSFTPPAMGQGLNQFYKNNPKIAKGADRAGQINKEFQQRRAVGEQAGRAAVQFTKETRGYSDANGKFVPPVNPLPPSSKYGTGSIKYYQPGEARPQSTTTDPLTGKKVSLRSFLDDMKGVQATKYGPDAGRAGQDYFNPRKVASGMASPAPSRQPAAQQPAAKTKAPAQGGWDALFPGDLTSAPQTRTASLPNFDSPGMPLPPLPNDTPEAFAAQSRAQSFPQSEMTQYTPPFSSPEQLGALNTLNQLYGNQSPASAGLESNWNNIFKGVNDWDYLSQLFPGEVQPNAGASQNMRRLQALYQDPVYQSRF